MTDEIDNDDEIIEDSTTAENILAWKELLSSKEAKDFVNTVLDKSTVLFGQTPSAKAIQTAANIALLISQ